METNENLRLIDGKFTCEDAKEILMNIFLSKIRFHEIKNFSSLERFGKPDEIATKRIPELKLETQKLSQLLLEAKLNNRTVSITTTINISLLEN